MLSLPSITVATALLLPLTVLAQEPPPKDPARADEHVPVDVYRSAFAGYQSLRDDDESPNALWSAANREAGDLGGHAGQIRETDTPASASQSSSMPTSPAHRHGVQHKQ
jgi:hypothetical protein